MEEPILSTQNVPQVPKNGTEEAHHAKNVYPILRHIFLVACVLCALLIIIFLMYQNGKSIYDNGI